MRKFENTKVEEAQIEIAQAFHSPNVCYLNRYILYALTLMSIAYPNV